MEVVIILSSSKRLLLVSPLSPSGAAEYLEQQIHCFLFLSCTSLKLLFAVTWQRSLSCLLTSAKASRVFTLAKSSLRSW